VEACERCSMKNKNNRMCLLLCCTEPKEVAVHLRAVRLLQCFVPSILILFQTRLKVLYSCVEHLLLSLHRPTVTKRLYYLTLCCATIIGYGKGFRNS